MSLKLLRWMFPLACFLVTITGADRAFCQPSPSGTSGTAPPNATLVYTLPPSGGSGGVTAVSPQQLQSAVSQLFNGTPPVVFTGLEHAAQESAQRAQQYRDVANHNNDVARQFAQAATQAQGTATTAREEANRLLREPPAQPSARPDTPPPSRTFFGSTPLDPTHGGRSIVSSVLEPGDIIVTANRNLGTRAGIQSTIIRELAGGAEVSHAIMYIGNGMVVEAVWPRVIMRPLEGADGSLHDTNLAVVFRRSGLYPASAQVVVQEAISHLGSPYNLPGLIDHPRFGVLNTLCAALTPLDRDACQHGLHGVRITRDRTDQFFCSQFIFDAFQRANLSIGQIPPSASSPGDVPVARIWGDVVYVGHLRN